MRLAGAIVAALLLADAVGADGDSGKPNAAPATAS